MGKLKWVKALAKKGGSKIADIKKQTKAEKKTAEWIANHTWYQGTGKTTYSGPSIGKGHRRDKAGGIDHKTEKIKDRQYLKDK